MRYLESENPYIIARFTTGDTVKISIYKLSDNSKIVDDVAMTEIGTTGYFKYQFNPSPTSLTEYLYIANNTIEEHAGKIILGGYPDGIKDHTDKMNFTGTDIKATLDGEEVTTDSASRIASRATGFATENPPSQNLDDYKADVSGIPTNPLLTNDTRLNNLDVAISTRSSHADPTSSIKGLDNKDLTQVFDNERGTDGANTTTPPTVEQIKTKMEESGSNLDFIKNIEGGKWQIVNNQMIFTKADNVTELCRFNLFNSAGNAAEINIYKRERV